MIYYCSPFDLDLQLARHYNAVMTLLPDATDYCCFTDGDATFTTPHYGRQIAGVTDRYPDCGLFYALTNRIGCNWQIAPGVDPRNDDMRYHRRLGAELAAAHGTDARLVNDAWPASGFLILVRKSLWQGLDGFRHPGMLGVDNAFYEDARRHGAEIRLMTGVYLYHWYRGQEPHNTAHLVRAPG